MDETKRSVLCLTRKAGEIVDITVGGEQIEVMMAGFDRGKFKLIFKAGPTVTIHRREVTERIAEGRP
jgi:carbon storage regulator CsrA